MSRIIVHTILFSLFVLLVSGAYLTLERGAFSLGVVNRAFAHAAFYLIGISFALSSLAHFWHVFSATIVYRKDIGLAGFAFAMAHSVVSLWFLPDRFPYPEYYLASENILSFAFAASALLIYAVMAAISNHFATHLLGGTIWRYLLRLGYVAYVYTVLHFGLKEYPHWIEWFTNRDHLFPHASFFLFLFGVLVILLRLSIWISQMQGTKKIESSPQQ